MSVSEMLDDDVFSLTSSDPAVSELLASSQDEQDKAVEIEDVSVLSAPLPSICRAGGRYVSHHRKIRPAMEA